MDNIKYPKKCSRQIPTEQRYEFNVGLTFNDESNIDVDIFDAVSNCSVKLSIIIGEDSTGKGQAVKSPFEYNVKATRYGTTYTFYIELLQDGEEADSARLTVNIAEIKG